MSKKKTRYAQINLYSMHGRQRYAISKLHAARLFDAHPVLGDIVLVQTIPLDPPMRHKTAKRLCHDLNLARG